MRILVIIVAASLVSACGLKGDLFLPVKKPAPVAQPAPVVAPEQAPVMDEDDEPAAAPVVPR